MPEYLSPAARSARRCQQGRRRGSSTARLLYPEEAEAYPRLAGAAGAAPGQKINHAPGLGGGQGIGKDTLLEPVKRAVGPWNFQEVSPPDLLEPFNRFVKAVVLRMSEAHDLGEARSLQLYERTKIYAAAPPDVLRVDKNIRGHYVLNASDSSSPPTTRLMAFTCRPMTVGTSWHGQPQEGAFRQSTGTSSGAGTRPAASTMSPPTRPSSISPASIQGAAAEDRGVLGDRRRQQAPEDAELADVLEALGNPDAVTPNS